MKIGLISDIHGNYEALKAVLGKFDEMNVSEIYCLGDVVGYYPQINECCEELRTRQIQCIMGNHDWYMVSGGFCPRSKSVNDCLIYQRGIITKNNLHWLYDLPIQRVVKNIHMVHGGWADPIDEYLLTPTAEYFLNIPGDIFVSGHTHIQLLVEFDGKKYCNPGSVGQPRDGDPKAAFGIYNNGEFYLHRVEYNPQKVYAIMKDAGFSDYYYGCLKTGSRTLCNLS